MAHAATVTVNEITGTGEYRTFEITVVETGGTTTGEWHTGVTDATITHAGNVAGGALPKIVTIVSRKVYKVSGTGVTYAPVWANTTGAIAAGAAAYIDGFSAAAYIADQGRVVGRLPTGILYGRSNPDAGTNNAITTELVVVGGVLR